MANEKQNQEWDSLGRSIEEIIDKAINSQNYQELSRNITPVSYTHLTLPTTLRV